MPTGGAYMRPYLPEYKEDWVEKTWREAREAKAKSGHRSEESGPSGGPTTEPNSTFFLDTVLNAALQRLEFYQTAYDGKFSCRANALAITKIEEALHWLLARRIERENRDIK